MPDRNRMPAVRLDTSVPALLVRIGHYPVHAGTLGVVRSLGRLGVPVYVITEDRLTPIALSRYVVGRFVWPDSQWHDTGQLVENLCAIGRSLGRPVVPVATDDEAAVLLAEHAATLGEHFLLPRVAPTLPRRLASKRGLFELCAAHDVPTPHTVFPTSREDLLRLAGELTFPVVAKNVAPWTRLRAAAVPTTTIVSSAHELLNRFAGFDDLSRVLLQEYIPHEQAEDWFVHAYCDEGSATVLSFVGRKAYAWPPGRGSTADARSARNPALNALTERFCKEIGYRGVNDLDWRYDRRDGRLKLVDFNPRVGAQFRFGQTEDGVDVVRALHLGMTGRTVPAGDQDCSRRLIVENLYAPAKVLHRLARLPAPAASPGVRSHGAWLEGSGPDPLPVLAMVLRFGGQAVASVSRAAYRRVRLRLAGRSRTSTKLRSHAGRPGGSR
ncbi:hypothetical protein GCM10009827_115050 [Dactylosporangium maewongense]|uniref:ATP-grasp domain-containing protein n=1 Tax=Dactylosporangium maewongense TaxID=634393 RepID=A0ABN2DEH4_9ACTN